MNAADPTERPRLTAIGLMSGTSMDGVDAALIETDGTTVHALGPTQALAYAADFRDRLRPMLGRPPGAGNGVAAVVRDLTLYHAEAVNRLLDGAGLGADDVDVVGFHGQTVFHDPANGVTCQIGDGALLARETGIDVVDDFRSADVAAGGEGAPFAPLFHVALARDVERPVAVLNLGGVGNVTWISPDGGAIAFDTGPGNALIDDWVAARAGLDRDDGGRLARAGAPDAAALAALLDNPYFDLPAPKSLDRDAFSLAPVDGLSLEDGAATLTAFTARSAARATDAFPAPVTRWLVTGGGRHNPALMAALRAEFDAPVEPVEAVGWNGDALEAQAFAYLAVRSLYGLPLSYPQTTGVSRPVTGGRLHKAS
ncbi:MAG: anhydro-N-acetylmuramic acid kinase [Magnetovibrio sp.]|nr:anhydro-N-acetylmuramic acid kinase [Magnetovibrio sp.]